MLIFTNICKYLLIFTNIYVFLKKEIGIETILKTENTVSFYSNKEIGDCFDIDPFISFRNIPTLPSYPVNDFVTLTSVFDRFINVSNILCGSSGTYNFSPAEDVYRSEPLSLSLSFKYDRSSFPRGIYRSWIPIKSYSTNFVSCSSLNGDKISFYAYLEPFQLSLWFGIFLAFISVAVTLQTVHYFNKDFPNVPFILICYAYLLEISVTLPGKLRQLTWLRIITGTFLVMAIILTNGYKGIVIVDLTSERPYQKIESLGDLAEYQIQSTGPALNNPGKNLSWITQDVLKIYHCYPNVFNKYNRCMRRDLPNSTTSQEFTIKAFDFCNKVSMCKADYKQYFSFLHEIHAYDNQSLTVADYHGFHPGFPYVTPQQWISQCSNSAYFFTMQVNYTGFSMSQNGMLTENP